MKNLKKTIIAGILMAILAGWLRIPTAGSFMTADEENWMIRSSQFWHELFRNHNISGTFLTTHPGATAMWISGAGIVWQEHKLHVDLDTSNIKDFRKYATAPIALTVSLLVGLATALLIGLFGFTPGVIMGLLLAADPYFVGMGQIVHLDALLSMFILNTLLCFLYFVKNNKWQWLIATGVMWGLALDTKMLLAVLLLPAFVGVWGIETYVNKKKWNFKKLIGGTALLVGTALVTMAIVWPALIARADFQMGYISRDTQTIITDEHVALSTSTDPIAPWTFYPRAILGRTTPHVLVVSIAASLLTIAIAFKQRKLPHILYFLMFAVGYVVVISFAAKKGDRYTLPALVMLPLITGWGMALVWQVIVQKSFMKKPQTQSFVLAFVVALLVLLPQLWSPYAIAYNNPLFPNIRPLNQQGWGEGLNAVGNWLNQQPQAERMYVASWYPSMLAPYFKGKTFSLSSRGDYRVSYVVTYRNMGGREGDSQASDVLDELKDKKPVFTFNIQGVPYAWVYATDSVGNFTQNVGEVWGKVEIGQMIKPDSDNWRQVRLGFATYNSRKNDQDVVVHIRSSMDAMEDLRTVRVNAKEIVDNEWHTFAFEPITQSAGKSFYVAVDSPTSRPGNAVTIKCMSGADVPKRMVVMRQELKSGEKRVDFLKSGG